MRIPDIKQTLEMLNQNKISEVQARNLIRTSIACEEFNYKIITTANIYNNNEGDMK